MPRPCAIAVLTVVAILGCAHTPQEAAVDAAAIGVEVVSTGHRGMTKQTGLRHGQQYTEAFYAGDLERIVSKFAPKTAQALPLSKMQQLQKKVMASFGSEMVIHSEKVDGGNGLWRYRRVASYKRMKRPMQVVWIFRDDGTIESFGVKPAGPAPSRHLKHHTQTALRLPFQDFWYVAWGGRSVEQNYHAEYRNQRFAYDLYIRRDGSTHAGDGRRLVDYYAFGKTLVSPGAGVVVSARGDLLDNPIGKTDVTNPLGNHVVIDHENGEFSFLAHLKHNTLAVKVGDRVTSGQLLGQCGNSGNTSEPHLHYHLQDNADFETGAGMPIQFLNYRADGKDVARGEPVQGQTVTPMEAH